MSLIFNHISFSYEESLLPLFIDLTAHFPKGWTGLAGPNGAGKTTVLRLAAGELTPLSGHVERPDSAAFCPQRTDDAPEGLSEFIASTEADASVLRGRLKLEADWADRWESLSHGERKRAQIAVALWRRPDVLLIDEPTNHIDLDARALLMEALESFGGVGLIVSHDRELLDRLCRQCLLIDPPDAILRPGNYTQAVGEARREEQTIAAKRRTARRRLLRLTRESNRRQAEAARSDARVSKKRCGKGDKDGRAKLNLARLSGRDAVAGRLFSQMEGRLSRMQKSVDDLKVKKRFQASFWLEGSLAPRDPLISLKERRIDLDGRRVLSVPEFLVRRDEKIALTGANGLGKSTFVRDMLSRIDVPDERLVYLPQEIDLTRTREIMAEVQALSNDELGDLMSVVSGLGSRPERLLENLEASPGETRKVLLALGVIRRPWLIVMDEPTNHLDLPAIELLESALKDCPCALILVSHDMRFLSGVARRRWHLQKHGTSVSMSLDTAFGSD